MAYNESQKKARDLDSIRPKLSLEAKLATNTYRVGTTSHIRTLWPEKTAAQGDMSQAGLWWVCPARVYGYDAPPFAGRGRVTVNYENCIKCESCWRAEPARTLWGRHTDHKLIYRPESAAFPSCWMLSERCRASFRQACTAGRRDALVSGDGLSPATLLVLNASAAFRAAVTSLPASADLARRSWPAALGKRFDDELKKLETMLVRTKAGRCEGDGRREALDVRLGEGRFFHAACCIANRIADGSWPGAPLPPNANGRSRANSISYAKPSRLLSRTGSSNNGKRSPCPRNGRRRLRQFITDHREQPADAVRALSSVSPALGLIAAHQFHAVKLLAEAAITLTPGICCCSRRPPRYPGGHRQRPDTGFAQPGPHRLQHAPSLPRGRGHLVPLRAAGVKVTPTPAIGFRAAALADITLDCSIRKQDSWSGQRSCAGRPVSYLGHCARCRRLSLQAGEGACPGQGPVPGPDAGYRGQGRHRKARRGKSADRAHRSLALIAPDAVRGPNPHPTPHPLNSTHLPTPAPLPSVLKPGPWDTMRARFSAGSPIPRTTCCRDPTAIQSLFRFLAPGYGLRQHAAHRPGGSRPRENPRGRAWNTIPDQRLAPWHAREAMERGAGRL